MQSYHVEVDDNKTIRWYNNSTEKKLHRVDGPAIEWADGSKAWFLNGQWHRVDGPAIEDADGYKCWYLNGKELTKSQHQAAVKKQADSYEDKVVEIEGKKYKLISV